MQGFLFGFQVVGILEDSRTWSPVEITKPGRDDTLLLERGGLLAEIERKLLHEDTAFLWESLMAEKKLGVANPPVKAEVPDEKYGPGRYMPTPCFCHTQACGSRCTQRFLLVPMDMSPPFILPENVLLQQGCRQQPFQETFGHERLNTHGGSELTSDNERGRRSAV